VRSNVTTVRELLETQAARLGARPLLALPDANLTYGEADELANRTAQALALVGVQPGDIVAVLAGNGRTIVANWFGCAKLGAVFMPVNALLSGAPLRNVLAHSGVATIVCDAPFAANLAAVRGQLPGLKRVLLAGSPRSTDALCFDELIEAAPDIAPPPLRDDPAAPTKLMYTSGTTGSPKGVLWSRHCEAVWARCYSEEFVPIADGEALYCCLPLSHITCQGTTLAALSQGGRITVDAGFDAFAFWNRVRAAEAVAFTFVGTILSVLGRRRPSPDDLDNPVRFVLGGAAPVDLWRHIEERFGLTIVEVWGQTETASCWTRPFSLPQEPGTVGRATERFEARVVGADGTDLPPGVPGELWIRPHQAHVMFEGYLGGQSGIAGVTAESWTNDGWYRTGDLMTRREDGEFSFVGRLREAVRRRGEMIAVSEIEHAALAHPAVGEAAAVGVPADDGVEEELKLCVVNAPGATLDLADVDRHLRASLPRFMVPRYLEIWDELPKTPTTRVRKYALVAAGRARAWDTRRHLLAPPAPINAASLDVEGPDGPGPSGADVLVEAARTLARELLVPRAEAVDRGGVPRSHIDALAAAGLLGCNGPVAEGGAAVPFATFRDIVEVLAGADCATWFVQAQHHSPLAMLVRSEMPVRDRLVGPLSRGELLGGVAFAHLRRWPSRPVAATPLGHGRFRLDGTAPWCTGWGLNDVVMVGAVTATGECVFAYVPATEQTGMRAGPRLRLAVLEATHTVRLEFSGLVVGPDDIVAQLPFSTWSAADRATTANVNPAVLGLTEAALAHLRAHADRPVVASAAAFTDQLHGVRAVCYRLYDEVADDQGLPERLAAKAEAVDLMLRATAALVVSGGGSALALDVPAQRLAREALFLAVQAQTTEVRDTMLARLTRPRPQG